MSSCDTNKNEHFSNKRKKFYHALWEGRFYFMCQSLNNYLRPGISSWKLGFQLHNWINVLTEWIRMKSCIQNRNKPSSLQVVWNFLKSPSFVWLYFSWIAFLLLLFENTCKLSTKAKKLHKLSLLEISLRSISQSKHLEVNIIHIEFHWQFLITYSSFWLVILCCGTSILHQK